MNDSNVFSEKNTESSLKTLPSEEKAKGIFPVAPPFLDDVPAAYLFRRIDGRILLGGELLSEGFEHRTVESPITLRSEDGNPYQPVLGTTPIADVSLMLKAVNCAAQAWNRGTGAWPTTRMEDRVKAVTRFRNLMKVKRQEVVTLLMWEICKTWNDACSEFDRTLAYIDDTIEAAKQLDREASRLQFAGGLMAQIRRMPLGVTLCMGPFNYPLNETFTTLIPALIMGNTTVVKLPRYGRLLWDPLLEAFAECFPPGVINVLNGEGRTVVGEAMSSGLIDVLAFIGSSRVASHYRSQIWSTHGAGRAEFKSGFALGGRSQHHSSPRPCETTIPRDFAARDPSRRRRSFNETGSTHTSPLFLAGGVGQCESQFALGPRRTIRAIGANCDL